MGKYRKRPVVVEAVQNAPYMPVPTWLDEAYVSGKIREQPGGGLAITTLEGVMIANPDDWIIRGVNGEIYPCKPDIFSATYDEVTP